MPISSLPSPYGIGTIGKTANEFIDFLVKAKQHYWQILPLGPTGFGDSPYASLSSFAGNPYLIDFDLIINQGLLTKEEVEGDWGKNSSHIEYNLLYTKKMKLLNTAAMRGLAEQNEAFDLFVKEQAHWLDEYALFCAVKSYFDDKPWIEWPDRGIRSHDGSACDYYSNLLAKEIRITKYIQYIFFSQWRSLKQYANNNGIRIIGDMPIYVALDSADTWAGKEWFQLNEDMSPRVISGCPPDPFAADGQLWGNPIFDWAQMREDDYSWWVKRISGANEMYDVLRIDHFRGFESFWQIDATEKTAKNGKWVKGPGIDVVKRIQDEYSKLDFIAEDLGYVTNEVKQLLEECGLPGMKVLEFAFDCREPSDYLPHNYLSNCVCYTGTHDNSTLVGWLAEASEEDVKYAKEYLGLNDEEGYIWGIIRGGMGSTANLFIAQMQDYLELGDDARINVPGTTQGNWTWRMKKDAITNSLAERIARLTVLYGRSS